MKKLANVFLAALMLAMLAAPQVMAADETMTAEERMEELRALDEGPDFSKGALIAEEWGNEEDGTPYVERTYATDIIPGARAINGTGRFYKVKSYGANGSVEVYATFSWDTAAKRVYVSNVTGKFNNGGVSGTRNELSTFDGSGTSRAWAQYSIDVDRNLGGWATYSVIMHCSFRGESDGVRIG